MQRTLTLATGLALALEAGGCGKPDSCANPASPGCGGPTPSPTPGPRVTTILDSGFAQLPRFNGLFRPITTTEVGTIEAIVEWTYATNNVFVRLARGPCPRFEVIPELCRTVASADSATTKPKKLIALNQPAATYTLMVVNFGPADESIAYQVLFTNGASAASASEDETTRR